MRTSTERPRRGRLVAALVAAMALAPLVAACTNTIEGAEKDGRKIFGTAGGSPATGKNPTPSNAKGAWQNPQ